RYAVSAPGQPQQASVPGPALGPDRPQGEDLSRLDHGGTLPISGPVPASSTDTGPPWPLGDPAAPTASPWPEAWVPDIAVPDRHGAAIPADFGHMDNQPDDGNENLDDWAYQGDLADLLDPFDPLHPGRISPPTAMDTEPDPGPQPTYPPQPQAPPGPTSWSQPSGDQPSQLPGTPSFPTPGLDVQDPGPQLPMPGPVPASSTDTGPPWPPEPPWPLGDPAAPTASPWPEAWVPDIAVPDRHGAAIPADFGHMDNQPDDGNENLDDWAYQGDLADLLDPFDPLHPGRISPSTAMDTEPDPGPQPTYPPQPQAPPGPTSWSQPSGDQPSQLPGTPSFPTPGLDVQDPGPQLPMPGPVPASSTDTGPPWPPEPPWPLGDPAAPTASPWPEAWVPDIAVPDRHGAAIPADFGHMDNQPDDGNENLDDWAYQGMRADTTVPDPADSPHSDPAGKDDPSGPGPASGDQEFQNVWDPDLDGMNLDTPHLDGAWGPPRNTGQVESPDGVSDPGQPQQAPFPGPPAGSQWVLDQEKARTLFDQHANHIATTTRQRDDLRRLWDALIDRMGTNGRITARQEDLAKATDVRQSTVQNRIQVLLRSGLLQLVQKGSGHGATQYGVSSPGKAPLPEPPAGSKWVLNKKDAWALFRQHADHIATTTQQQRDGLPPLWNALIDRMDNNGTITASLEDLAKATTPHTAKGTVQDRIKALLGSGLLRVEKGHGRVAARYRVTDPGRPWQAPVPGPAPEPDRRPQGSEDLSWLDHGDTSPMPGPVPAPPAGTGLPGLPGPLDDPDALTASSWPAGPAASSWPVEGAGPAGRVSGSGVTDGHGAAIPANVDPPIGNQPGDGRRNRGDWATG
ncbi:hypothetical protein ACFY2R_29870, partial [Micromonospora olivasterospora]